MRNKDASQTRVLCVAKNATLRAARPDPSLRKKRLFRMTISLDFRKAGHSPPTVCRHTVSGTISLPSQGFFSPFPHGTGSLSVRSTYLALRDGPRSFPQGFTCPAVLRYLVRVRIVFAYVAITLYGPAFQRASTNNRIGNSTVAGPTTPAPPEGETGLG